MYSATSSLVKERLGITHIVTVMKDAGYGYPSGIRRLSIPVDDNKDAELWQYFRVAVHWIQEALNSSKDAKVMVHCIWGKSRSASVVMAYLMATKRISAVDAFFLVKRRRSFIQPNKGFLQQLLIYEEKLKNEDKRRDSRNKRAERLSLELNRLSTMHSPYDPYEAQILPTVEV